MKNTLKENTKFGTEKNAGVTKKICFNLKRFRKRTAIEGLKQRFYKRGWYYVHIYHTYDSYMILLKACFVCLIN